MPQHRRYPSVHPYTAGFSNRFQSLKERLDLSPAQYETATLLWHTLLCLLNVLVFAVFWAVDAFEVEMGPTKCGHPSWLNYDVPQWAFLVLCILSLLLLLAFLFTATVTPSPRQHLLSLNAAVECVTSVATMGVWIASSVDANQRKVYLPYFLRVWPLLSHMQVVFEMRASKSLQAPLTEVVRLLAAMLTSAGLFHVAENMFGTQTVSDADAALCRAATPAQLATCSGKTPDAHCPSVPTISFFESIYFTVVTFGTIGYGDIEASNGLSRAVVACVILFAIYRFPSFFTRMGELAEARDRTLEYEDHAKGHAHVVVSGNLDTETIAACLEMFCRGGNLVRDVDGRKFRVVVLSPNEFSQHTQLLVNGPTFDGRVMLLRGNPQSLADLARAKVHEALAHFYVCNAHLGSDEADTATIMHARKHVLAAPGVPQYLTIRRSENAAIIKARLGLHHAAGGMSTHRRNPFLPPTLGSTLGSVTDSTFAARSSSSSATTATSKATAGASSSSSAAPSKSAGGPPSPTARSAHSRADDPAAAAAAVASAATAGAAASTQHHAVILERDKILYALLGAACAIPGAVPLMLSLAGAATKELHGKALHPWCDMYEWGLESEVMRCACPAGLVGRTFFEISDAFAEFDITVLGFEIEEEVVSAAAAQAAAEQEHAAGGLRRDSTHASSTFGAGGLNSSSFFGASLTGKAMRLPSPTDKQSKKELLSSASIIGSNPVIARSYGAFFDSDTTDEDEDLNAKGSAVAAASSPRSKRSSRRHKHNNDSDEEDEDDDGGRRVNGAPPAPARGGTLRRLDSNVAKIALQQSRAGMLDTKNNAPPPPPPPKLMRRRLLLNPKGRHSVADATTRLLVVAISGAVVMEACEHLETHAEEVLALAEENNYKGDDGDDENDPDAAARAASNKRLAVTALMEGIGASRLRARNNNLYRSASGDLRGIVNLFGAEKKKQAVPSALGATAAAAAAAAASAGDSAPSKTSSGGAAAIVIPPEVRNNAAATAASPLPVNISTSPFRRVTTAPESTSMLPVGKNSGNDENAKPKPLASLVQTGTRTTTSPFGSPARLAAAASAAAAAATAAPQTTSFPQQQKQQRPQSPAVPSPLSRAAGAAAVGTSSPPAVDFPGFTLFDPTIFPQSAADAAAAAATGGKKPVRPVPGQHPNHASAATALLQSHQSQQQMLFGAGVGVGGAPPQHASTPAAVLPDPDKVLKNHILLLDLHSACKSDSSGNGGGNSAMSAHGQIDSDRARARKLFSLCRTAMLTDPSTPVVLLARGKVDFSFCELWATTPFPNAYHVDGCALDTHALKLCRPQDAKGVAIFSTHDGSTDGDFDTMAMLVSRAVDVMRRKKAQVLADAAEAKQRQAEQDAALLHQPQQQHDHKRRLSAAVADHAHMPSVTTIIAFTQPESIALLPPFAKPRSVLDEMAQVSAHYIPSFIAGRVLTPQMVDGLLFFSFFSPSLLDVVHAMLSIDGGNDRPAFGVMPVPPRCHTWRDVRRTLRTQHGYQPIALYRLIRAIQSKEEYRASMRKQNHAANMGLPPTAAGLDDDEEDELEDNENLSRAAMAAKRSFRYRARLARLHGLHGAGDSEQRAARHDLRFVYLNPQLGSTSLVATDLVFYLK